MNTNSVCQMSLFLYADKRLWQSWERSAAAGLRRNDLPKVKQIDGILFSEKRREYKNFLQCLEKAVSSTRPILEELRIAFALHDSEGCILEIAGSEWILKELERKLIKPGLLVSEATIGTTAPTLCLSDGHEVLVMGEQHYLSWFHSFICFAIPLREEGHFRACLCATSTVTSSNRVNELIVLSKYLSGAIESEVSTAKFLAECEVYKSCVNYLDIGIVILDDRGFIKFMNIEALKMLGLKECFVGQPVAQVLGFDLDYLKKNKLLKIKDLRGMARDIEVEEIEKNKSRFWVVKINNSKSSKCLPSSSEQKSDLLQFRARYRFSDIVTANEKMVKLIDIAKKAAKTNLPVLIEGETGTGKELLAQSIHNASDRASGPFIALNCAAIPENLADSELFGYEGGAFTGALKTGRAGKIELASGGTLFLDEIHLLPVAIQAKLLRVLEEQTFSRVGGTSQKRVDVRVIAASGVDLEKEVQAGKFASALYYRLCSIRLSIPPLRERKDDIELLCRFFLDMLSRSIGCERKVLSKEALLLLQRYPWPGNVRQLKHAIEYAIVCSDGEIITIQDLPPEIRLYGLVATNSPHTLETECSTLQSLTRKAIQEALKRYPSKKEAARELGISVATLYRKIKKFGII